MNILVDTHSHTLVSGHAYSSMKEMAQAASEKGLEALALTEHGPDMLGAPCLYYFLNSRVLPPTMCGVKMLYGVELNILDEKGRVDLDEAVCNKLDIVIASMHTPLECYGASKGIVKNTEAYVNAMKHPFVHIIGHPDDSRLPVDYDTLVAAAKEYHVLLEVNNSSVSPVSSRVGAVEGQLKYLELCKKYGVHITTGSDAHVDLDVGNFTYARKIFEQIDFPEELVVSTSYDKLVGFINNK